MQVDSIVAREAGSFNTFCFVLLTGTTINMSITISDRAMLNGVVFVERFIFVLYPQVGVSTFWVRSLLCFEML